MTASIPRISVIVPVHNGEVHLQQAVDSIRSQPIDQLELVIVDDASTDSTAELITHLSPDVAVRFDENCGPGAARNAGVAAASGDWLAFLDADDLWPESSLTSRAEVLREQPDVGLVIAATVPFVEGAGDEPVVLLLSFGAALVRRDTFGSVGPFDVSMRFGEDIDWFMRAREQQVPTHYLSTVALRRRIHATNMTNDRVSVDHGFLLTMKQSLDRRRIQQAAAGRADAGIELAPVAGLEGFELANADQQEPEGS